NRLFDRNLVAPIWGESEVGQRQRSGRERSPHDPTHRTRHLLDLWTLLSAGLPPARSRPPDPEKEPTDDRPQREGNELLPRGDHVAAGCYNESSVARRLLWTSLAALAPLVLSGSCAQKESPGYYQPPGVGAAAGASGAAGGAGQLPPLRPARGVCPGEEPIAPRDLCGTALIPVEVKRPNPYSLLDGAGRMEDPIARRLPKLEASKSATLRVAQVHGHRLNYGLATFPASS